MHRATGNAAPAKQRDAEATRQRILAAAQIEFAKLGFAGARIDTIAERSRSNKRMIYEYFGGKAELFQAVIETAWKDIRYAETKLKLEEIDPEQAIEKLVRFTWKYYIKNPHFIRLVNSENLHKAVHIKKVQSLHLLQQNMVDMVRRILDRGAKAGIFRKDIDPVQLTLSIAAVNYYYLSNRFTGSFLFGFDFMDDAALEKRLEFNIRTILATLRP